MHLGTQEHVHESPMIEIPRDKSSIHKFHNAVYRNSLVLRAILLRLLSAKDPYPILYINFLEKLLSMHQRLADMNLL